MSCALYITALKPVVANAPLIMVILLLAGIALLAFRRRQSEKTERRA